MKKPSRADRSKDVSAQQAGALAATVPRGSHAVPPSPESENRYHQLFEMESDAIFLVDSETCQILESNLASQTLYGYSREEFMALRNFDLSAEPELTKHVTRVVAEQKPSIMVIVPRKHRKRDGTVFPVEITARSFELQGRSVHLAAVRDVTERERVEQALRDSQNRSRQLFEMESDAIFLIDLATGRFLDLNLAAQDLYGYSREELLRRGPVDISAEPELTKAIIRNGAGSEAPLLKVPLIQHRKKDGSLFPVEITGRYFTLSGSRVLIVAIRDITERVRAQSLMECWNASLERSVTERTAQVEKYARQLQALTERLVRAEEAERQRITDVLHDDLQQVLVAARMTLVAAQGSIAGATAKAKLSAVEDMLTQSIRLTRSLVQEIAVPGVREGDLSFATGCLAQQMQEKFDLGVRVTAPAGLEPVAENIYFCLFRSIQELLFNVAKHAQVKQAHVELRKAGDGLIQIRVSDQGCGLSAAALADSYGANNGYGLFSIRERIEGLGGRMEIASAEGQGTTVTLTAPAR